MDHDKALRQQLIELLKGGNAHVKFEDAVENFPEALRGQKAANLPHSAWMLLEHLRIAQWDILEFSRDRKHKSPDGRKATGQVRVIRRPPDNGMRASGSSIRIGRRWRNWLKIQRRTCSRRLPGVTARQFCGKRCSWLITMHITWRKLST